MPFLSWIRRLFRGQAKSTLERLEDIENDILDLESMRTSSIDSEKRFVFRLLLYSFISFGIMFLLIYYYYWPSTQYGKILLFSSLLIYPSLVSGLKWLFHAFFLRSISRADEKLKALREEKQRLLEEVMENETFNKAQQILKRFDPLMFARLTAMESDLGATPRTSCRVPVNKSSTVRRRMVPTATGDNLFPGHPASTPMLKPKVDLSNGCDPHTPITRNPELTHSRPQPPPQQRRLHRPILPRERSIIDRLLDSLVGDGPDKRYALICNECAAHNGMALKEEFEFLAFRCCYCFHFNPPRRTRLRTPVPSNILPRRLSSVAGSDDNTTPLSSDPCTRSMIDLRDRSLSPNPPSETGTHIQSEPPSIKDSATDQSNKQELAET